MIVGIILAAGEGTRLNPPVGGKNRNKVTLPFLNKPLIVYGVELMMEVCDQVVVVIGAYHESVKQVLKNYPVIYAYQKKRLGTAHATKMGLESIKKTTQLPDLILVGYGDHTMFYKKETIQKLIDSHIKNRASISLITFEYDHPDQIRYGRIIRNKNGSIRDIVEQKDATNEQRLIKEVNPGFYCFNYDFIRSNIGLIKKSPIFGEYYLTEMVKIAVTKNFKIISLKAEFSEVGLGINTAEELSESEKIYLQKE